MTYEKIFSESIYCTACLICGEMIEEYWSVRFMEYVREKRGTKGEVNR